VNLDAALKTFLAESRDLLMEMESSLLACERGRIDDDAINGIFRAAHTIKGSSGLFGLEAIVKFTHGVEGTLDAVRNGARELTPELIALLVECRDHMQALIDDVARGGEANAPTLSVAGAVLTARLHGETPPQRVEQTSPPITATADDIGDNFTCTDCWHISVRFGADVLRNGMDPLSFIRYLTTFGTLCGVQSIEDRLPMPDEFDPEACYLGFEIRLKSDADKARIEAAFEFVRDDCKLTILPPRARIAEFVDLLQSTPDSQARLGELLVSIGTLTAPELARALDTQRQLAEHQTPTPLGEILVQQRAVQPAVIEAAVARQKTAPEYKHPEQQSIRVDAHKLEHLIDLIGELIITGAGTHLIAQRARLSELSESASRLSRLVEEVRDCALQLRMVQIGATFSRFQRVVRDVSRELGKDIRLDIAGSDTELDKTLVEQINDPLTHLVRNAVDHGIESADLRVERGKNAQGVVRLNAYHDSGSVVIEVSDDGGGLDRSRILAKAQQRGLTTADAQLSDREVFAFIFEPGFSTADTVTNLSGRGVGMDVVRKNVTALRGAIEVDSVAKQGTTFRIRLPLTLAIVQGFLVGIGPSKFIFPLANVIEVIEGREATSHIDASVRDAKGRCVVELRGHTLPVVDLRRLYELDSQPIERPSIVVLDAGTLRFGVMVDTLLGQYQTVIKPLACLFGGLQGIAGSSILGNGEVALIFDVVALGKRASDPQTHSAALRELT